MNHHDLLPAEQRFDQIKTLLPDSIAAGERRRTRNHRLLAIGVTGILVGGATAGAVAIAQAPQGQINYLADCYAAADMDARHGSSIYLPGFQKTTTPTPLGERIALAEDMCAASWRSGVFLPQPLDPGQEAPVPQLETCQLPDRRLAVFPSDLAVSELCSQLGLTSPHE